MLNFCGHFWYLHPPPEMNLFLHNQAVSPARQSKAEPESNGGHTPGLIESLLGRTGAVRLTEKLVGPDSDTGQEGPGGWNLARTPEPRLVPGASAPGIRHESREQSAGQSSRVAAP